MAQTYYEDKNILNHSVKSVNDELFNFSRCSLVSLCVPKSKQLTMCRILKPFVRHFEVLGNAIEVVERDQSCLAKHFDGGAKPRIPPYTVTHDQMTSPAISVMLFLPEFGRSRAEKVKSKFRKAPWHIHHSIQLQKQKSSDVIGKHEFYFLSRSYPLWSVCPAPQSSRVLRVNIFVRRYSAMVEFYRLVTGSEMESSKPGFCVFTLNTQNYSNDSDRNHFTTSSKSKASSTPPPPNHHAAKTSNADNVVSVELALKHCPHINPFSLSNAYLTFPVPSITLLKTVLHNYIRPLTSTHYLVHDPDGNSVVLYDLSAIPTYQSNEMPPQTCLLSDKNDFNSSSISSAALEHHTPTSSSVNSILTATSKNNVLHVDKASIRSESWDSGRFSDFETMSYNTATDLDQCMAKLFPNENNKCGENDFLNNGDDNLGNYYYDSFKDSSFNFSKRDVDDVANILESLSGCQNTDQCCSDDEEEEEEEEETEEEEKEEEERICQVRIGELSLIEDNYRHTSGTGRGGQVKEMGRRKKRQ